MKNTLKAFGITCMIMIALILMVAFPVITLIGIFLVTMFIIKSHLDA